MNAPRPAFAQYLIDMVRTAPDDVVLDLVMVYLQQRGSGGRLPDLTPPPTEEAVPVIDPAKLAGAIKTRPSRARAAREATRPSDRRRARLGRDAREAQLADIERVVTERDEGVSRADVVEALSISAAEAGRGLKALTTAGRIHRAGERRLTRYGRTKAIAEAASKASRS
jgi:hypothetical protein